MREILWQQLPRRRVRNRLANINRSHNSRQDNCLNSFPAEAEGIWRRPDWDFENPANDFAREAGLRLSANPA